MAIDIRNYRPVTDGGPRRGDGRSYYILTRGERTQCRLTLGKEATDELFEEYGGSVGLSYSKTSGVLVIHRPDYDNSRMVSRATRNGRAADRGSLSTVCMADVLRRMFGEHRRYYVEVIEDVDLEGGRVYVVAPTGEVS